MTPDLVLFDADCGFCRSLAELAARRAAGALSFISWQEFQVSDAARQGLPPEQLARPADRLRVYAEGALVEGESAWAFLLERHRDLAGLDWLAARLGLTRETAKVLNRSGELLRRLCSRCRR